MKESLLGFIDVRRIESGSCQNDEDPHPGTRVRWWLTAIVAGLVIWGLLVWLFLKLAF